MRNGVIIILLGILSGCASTQEIANTVPTAIGTVAAAAVFGGEVSMNPEPVGYITEEVNREGRYVYGNAQRGTKEFIAASIIKLFEPTK